MTTTGRRLARRCAAGLALLAALLLLSACEGFMRGSGVLSEEERLRREQELVHAQSLRKHQVELTRRQKILEKSLAHQVALGHDLEGKLAKLHMLLLEREAQNEELNNRLGEAILEVVRAKAKLRSLESKAEAASNLAEAEIALKALVSKSPDVKQDRKYERASELLALGATEFKKQNFGGALYLSGQAKALIRESQEQTTTRQDLPLLPGETPFTLPIRLRAEDASNLRSEPTLASQVMATLKAGEALIGHSYRGKWVRVQDETGRVGWIFYDLVRAR